MSNLLVRLWASDEASALTNEAAREIERLERQNADFLGLLDGMQRNILLTIRAYSSDSGHSIHGQEKP